MLLKLLKLPFAKNATVDAVCLDNETYSAKKKVGDVKLKIPVITYASHKDDDQLHDFISRNNISIGEIPVGHANIVYMESLNCIGIGIRIEKNKMFNIKFELDNHVHLSNIIAFFLSKSMLIASNKNRETAMSLSFKEDDALLSNKVKTLLPKIVEKIGFEYLKFLPENKDAAKNQLLEYIQKNPGYLASIFDSVKTEWTVKEGE